MWGGGGGGGGLKNGRKKRGAETGRARPQPQTSFSGTRHATLSHVIAGQPPSDDCQAVTTEPVSDRQTDRQTDKQTAATRRSTLSDGLEIVPLPSRQCVSSVVVWLPTTRKQPPPVLRKLRKPARRLVVAYGSLE